jgi:O-antigen/teichoic acid export membrane protein
MRGISGSFRAPRVSVDQVDLDDDMPVPAGGARSHRYVWGFVSQGCSSATNLGLAIVAARVLGPVGLGAVMIAFGSYVAILALQRGLITDPLLARSSQVGTATRTLAGESALTMTIVGALGATVLMSVAGAVVRGDTGNALLAISLWLPALLLQDYWRCVLFRDDRARAAAINDASWLLVMIVAAPLAWVSGATSAVIATWGAGALAGAVLGVIQTRYRPRTSGAVRWWRRELWPLGRWLGVNSVGHVVATYALLFVFAYLFGTAGLGGYRAVVTVFAPLSLIASAIALPGLPALSRSHAESKLRAVRLATRLGLVAVVATAGYVLAMSANGGVIIPLIFGTAFKPYADLIWPVGIAQLATAAGVGYALLLKAQSRGLAVLFSDTFGGCVALVLSCLLGALYGLTAAVWGLCGGAFVWAASTIALARHAQS